MSQDSLQLPATSPFSCSNLGEVVSEVADSQAESRMQDLSQPDEAFSYSTSELVEKVEEATASEAVRLLAARIPPELFDNILFYVNVHCRSGIYLQRKQGGRTSRDMSNDLTQCSLVCLFWANRCREHMFSEKTLWIISYKDAEIFRRYIVGGCPRLTPVHRLIEHITVTQQYSGERAPNESEKQTSFLHLLYLPAIQDKLKRFSIKGPVLDGFNPAKLDTPHWGIPPCIVVPNSFLRHDISIRRLHLPSFYHVTKYIRHFSCAAFIHFEDIKWDGQTPTYSLPQASNTITCQRRPRSLVIYVEGVCTDTVHLALTAVMMNPNCPLHRLSDEERVWMIKSMTLLWGNKLDPDVRIEFNVSEQATTMRMHPLHFVFEEASASTDRPDSALSVVGMHAYIEDSDDLPANFDALVNHARTHPTIRVLVLLLHSFDLLQESLKPFLEVLTLATETIELVLAYEKKEERKAVGVDLVTLEPSGVIWADVVRYSGASREILRRELKKRR